MDTNTTTAPPAAPAEPAIDLGDLEGKIAVKFKTFCDALEIGETQGLELLRRGEIEAFKDGSRCSRITVASIKKYLARRLADAKSRKRVCPRQRKRLQDTPPTEGRAA